MPGRTSNLNSRLPAWTPARRYSPRGWDYSSSGQVEARWQLSERWGLVGFAGIGDVGSSYSELQLSNSVPSYGAGLRFMVLKSKRINLRIDYARSDDSDAVHVSVGEAF